MVMPTDSGEGYKGDGGDGDGKEAGIAMEMVEWVARWFQRKSDEVSVTLTPI
jgi:hypothetical protein